MSVLLHLKGECEVAELKILTELIGELNEDGVYSFLNDFMITAQKHDGIMAVSAAQEGMAKVGKLYEKGNYFLGDLIYAGDILTGAMEILKPLLEGEEAEKAGTIVLGTVQGDLHDIGKKIFSGVAEISGFEVYDLGIDVPASEFVRKATEVNADIIGLSGVLTMAISEMKYVVDALKEAGIRDKVKVILGGNCVSDEVCEAVGADAATRNAATGIEICKEWMKTK